MTDRRNSVARSITMLAALIVTFAAIPDVANAQRSGDMKASPTNLQAPRQLGAPGRALQLSLLGTLLPVTSGILLIAAGDEDTGSPVGALLFASGLYLGPALGYWTEGSAGRGWKGVGVRFGTGLTSALLATAICAGGGCDMFGNDDAMGAASAVLLVGSVVTLISAGIDIASVKGTVDRRNETILVEREQKASLRLLPIASLADGGSFGVSGTISF